jgi:hypothetical protein
LLCFCPHRAIVKESLPKKIPRSEAHEALDKITQNTALLTSRGKIEFPVESVQANCLPKQNHLHSSEEYNRIKSFYSIISKKTSKSNRKNTMI